jgi:hypothetical protein
MTQQHTPEPWKVITKGTVPLIVHKGDIRMPIAVVQEVYMSRAQRQANARRIVACINACKGWTTEELETGTVEVTQPPPADES